MESNCSGCSACYLICKFNAISMKINEYGFYRPCVDEDKCTHCNLCNKVCMIKEGIPLVNEVANVNLYSAFTNENEIRHTSSSGGIGYEIARQGIKDGYDICGVIYDEKEHVAKHIVLNKENKNKLSLLQGSKYIQSINAQAFKKISNSQKAIIFGTPCQIAGLDMILRKKGIRRNFILIDVFCHGVPTYNLWNKYLKFINDKYKVGEFPKVLFRNKKLGWHKYYINIYSEDNSYIKFKEFDPFLKLFCNAACNSLSCYKCKFRTKTASDIRLGDYWGKRHNKDDSGYSMVATNTLAGLNCFNKLENISAIITPRSEYKAQQTDEIEIPKFREKILNDLLKESINIKKIMRLYPNYYYFYLKHKLKKIIPNYIVRNIKKYCSNKGRENEP
jgi:coenzyme F420-reducing hydrogenase beta subunit